MSVDHPTTSKRCSKCGEIKPTTAFGPSKQYSGGLKRWCRDCFRAYMAPRRERYRGQKRPEPEAKRCCRCGEVRAIVHFCKNRGSGDGRNSHCRSCNYTDKEKARVLLAELDTGLRCCRLCGEMKPPEEFHYSSRKAARRERRCKACRHRPRPNVVAKQRDIEAGERQCKDCGETKPLDQYYQHKNGSILGRCKACVLVEHRLYRQAHPEIYSKATLKYHRANPEVVRAINRRRKGRKKGAEGDFTNDEWLALKAKHGNRCLLCGMCEPLIKLTPDHIVPLSKGGTNYIANIQPLCAPCNSSKGTKDFDLRDLGHRRKRK